MPAKSKQQQKFMGIVRSIQQGDEPASKFSKSAQDAAEDMKEKDVEDFASTKHKGLPKKVEQYLRQKIRKEVTQMIDEDWFDRLSSDDQKKYVKDHPGSKKAKQAAHDKEREKRARKIRSKNYTVDGDGNIVKVKKTKEDPKKHAKHMAALKKGYMPGDDNYEKFIKKESVNEINDKFVKYMNDFYGPKGLYVRTKKPLTLQDINKGYSILLKKRPKYKWDDGDSFDRENVRDELIKLRILSKDLMNKKESVNERIILKYNGRPITTFHFNAPVSKKISTSTRSWIVFDNMKGVKEKFKNHLDHIKKDKSYTKQDLETFKKMLKRIRVVKTESVNEAFTGGDRKILFVIARELADNLKKVGLKGKQLERVMSSAIVAMRLTPDNLNYKKFKRFFPRGYNSKLVKRLLDKFHDQYDAVRWTFIRQAIGESVNEAKRITRGNRGVKVGDTVKFFDRDRNPAHYRGKVKWIMKAKKNKEFVDFIYITAKGNFTDQHLDGTKAYNWHYRRREGVNERVSHSEAKVILSQLGGSKFIAMTGAKNFGVGNEGLSMSIGKNSKRITHFIVDYNRGRDLYNLEFVRMWGGKRISVKKLKSVYFDDLQYHFKKYTGLNTRF